MFAVALALLKSTASKSPPSKAVTEPVSVLASRYTSSVFGLGTLRLAELAPAGMVTAQSVPPTYTVAVAAVCAGLDRLTVKLMVSSPSLPSVAERETVVVSMVSEMFTVADTSR